MPVDAGIGRWMERMGFQISPNPHHFGIIQNFGCPRVKGQKLSLILRQIHSSFPSSKKILRARQRGKKKKSADISTAGIEFLRLFCTSGMGGFIVLWDVCARGAFPTHKSIILPSQCIPWSTISSQGKSSEQKTF